VQKDDVCVHLMVDCAMVGGSKGTSLFKTHGFEEVPIKATIKDKVTINNCYS
jgi:hypothetical protein